MTKKTLRAQSLTALVTLSASLVIGAGSANAVEPTPAVTATPAPASSAHYRDYLNDGNAASTSPVVGASQIAGVGQDQCARPLAQRTGAWMCIDPSTLGKSEKKPPTFGSAETTSFIATTDSATADQNWCWISICWDRASESYSDLHGQGPYGYGKTTIGTMNFNANFAIRGGKITTTNLYMQSTHNIKDGYITGDRLYISKAHPEGKPVSPDQYAEMGPCQTPANIQCKTQFVSFENTVQTTSQVHEFIWHTQDYPGRWYVYAKSIVADRQGSGAYYFRKDGTLPQDASAGNYSADY